MGQQQLILLVLATVIVGLAIVVGIRAFTENSARANADAMLQDAVRIANDMQAWKKKPAPFGGQAAVTPNAEADDFTGADFGQLGYGTGLVYTNLNGTFTLDPVAGTITGVNDIENNTVVVAVCGVTDLNIIGAITRIGGNAVTTTTPSCDPEAGDGGGN
jgi:hypothetical protein